MSESKPRVGLIPAASEGDDPGGAGRWLGLLADRGISAETLGGRLGPRSGEMAAPAWARRWREFWSVRRLAGRQGGPPQLIHALDAHGAEMALDLAERWRVPYLVTVDEFLRPGEGLRLSRRWCRGVVATGAELAEDLVREAHLPSRIVSVIPPGVAVLREPDLPNRTGWVPVVGAIVAPGPGSGLPAFLQAARRVSDAGRDAEFVVASGGSGLPARRLAEGLGIADRITLAECGDAGPSFWAVLDVYCHPTRLPTSGKSLAAALARGIPAIASDVPGVGAWVEDGISGRVVPPGDADALAAAILDFLDRPHLAAEMGRQAGGRIRRDFSPGAQADALAALYRKATGSSEGVFPRVRSEGAGGVPPASRRS